MALSQLKKGQKMARRPSKDGQKEPPILRDQTIALRLTAAERERLERMASGRGSVSDYIRSRLFNEPAALRKVGALREVGLRVKALGDPLSPEAREVLALTRKAILNLARRVDDDR
ncbi:MAG: hypothetical protein ACTHOL_19140 [Luteibacter jiangsuensis]